jgi:hypothetical protein
MALFFLILVGCQNGQALKDRVSRVSLRGIFGGLQWFPSFGQKTFFIAALE